MMPRGWRLIFVARRQPIGHGGAAVSADVVIVVDDDDRHSGSAHHGYRQDPEDCAARPVQALSFSELSRVATRHSRSAARNTRTHYTCTEVSFFRQRSANDDRL